MPTEQQTETRKPPKHGLRITVTMEAPNEEMMQWALTQGFQFAREHWIGVTVSHKDDPTTRVSCRTTRRRKPAPSETRITND